MEGFVVIIGLCITFVPVVIFAKYVFDKVSKETRFDSHLAIVKDKKGTVGVLIAYLERILFGTVICSSGIVLSEYFRNKTAIEILIVSVILFIIVRFFDEKNEK
jgi:ABC-type Mn2+/Zn2+ transport system permease subunit